MVRKIETAHPNPKTLVAMNTLYRIRKIVESHSMLLLIGLFLAGVATAILVFKILQVHP